MAELKLRHIYKVYDNGVKAVSDFNLDIKDKEFIVIVGPSGCGKSTTLRMIAGLEDISAGELRIGDRLCNNVEPKNRNIAMVFQNYALFPNMTVYDNIAFGLRMHKVSKDEIKRKVSDAAKLLGISEYLKSKPKELSGGQRQRVALGRAIVRDPNVFLLDEPLSNLDAKLRSKMRTELTRLHKRLGTTFVYVTHDQTEAMTMGDRIVVMKRGVIQQIDTPQNLFAYPVNKFVAGFIGTPQINFFKGKLKKERNGDVSVLSSIVNILLKKDQTYRIIPRYIDEGREVMVGFRPNDISLIEPEKKNYAIVEVYISLIEELGAQTVIYANTDKDEIYKEDSPTQLSALEMNAVHGLKVGDKVTFYIDTDHIHLFNIDSEMSIRLRVPEHITFSGSVKDNKLYALDSEIPLVDALKEVKDGSYRLSVRSDRLSLSPDGIVGLVERVHYLSDDVKILRIRLGDTRVYVTTLLDYKVGDSLKVLFPQESLEFYKGDEVVMKRLPRVFKLPITFEKEKLAKEWHHYLDFKDFKLEPPVEFDQKMYDRGKKIFKTRLSIEFTFKDFIIRDGENTVSLPVLKILDYGDNSYAKVSIEGQDVFVKVEKNFHSDTLNFTLDFTDVHVIDDKIDMRLF
jgi:multiple sugar transport system ATP-binding protein